MSQSRPCSRPGCRRKTLSASGTCHDHRGVAPSRSGARIDPRLAREDGESTCTTEKGGRLETWRNAAGKIHRLDGPAVVNREWSGQVWREMWKANGKTHRLDGPAITTYWENGRVEKESYERYGRGLSRLDGPAETAYDQDGNVTKRVYYFGGEPFFAPPIEDRQAFLLIEEHRLADELRGTVYDEFLAEGTDLSVVAEALWGGVRTPAGIREVLGGAPVEWVRAYEEGSS